MQIDARGKTCPQPVVMAMKALSALAGSGAAEPLEVLVSERVAVENLSRLAASRGTAASVEEKDGCWRVLFSADAAGGEAGTGGSDVEPGTAGNPACPAPAVADADAAAAAPTAETPGATVLVGRNTLGSGSDELGAVLMRGVLYALSQRGEVPRRVIFFNSGAYLTSAGSDVLEDIRELERRGTEVLTCGTCLDYLGIKDQLAVGGVTNLYALTEAMMEPGKVITL